ncbi:MAG TPA: NUDIX hydrolase [Nocardioides bacterium]|uniref:NUDIX domain-containing protein n=1 Tax=uncultured Nocardioides sp. TaxID=198441 RepID=UPI000EE9DF05|nr:NUDIX hydrolase [uncultured Nocardioides sp.]HCB02740.1 NUDIX hydrolase [Nocardioides sp.]HRD64235.1 NUDIX hydrolase [Nocardioides sp.]
MSWQQRSSREVYANHYIRVLEDEVTRPDGSPGMFGLLEVRAPAVFVVPVTADDRIVMVHCDRYTTGTSWEVPAGGSDGQELRAAGERELAEETGYAAARWDYLGGQWGLNGVARSRIEVFLARDLTRVSTTYDEGEGIGAVEPFSWDEVKAMLRDERINDNESAGALLLAAIELGWT